MTKIFKLHRKDGSPYWIEIEIDMEELAIQMAAKAVKSIGGKSQALYGAVKCKTRGNPGPY